MRKRIHVGISRLQREGSINSRFQVGCLNKKEVPNI